MSKMRPGEEQLGLAMGRIGRVWGTLAEVSFNKRTGIERSSVGYSRNVISPTKAGVWALVCCPSPGFRQ